MSDKYYTQDIRKYRPKIATTDVKDTQMLKGEGKFTPAQNEENETIPFTTGKAPDPGHCGGEATH